jgi:hypothetical protein
MNTPCKVIASLLALFAGGLLFAADSKPIARVIAVTEVETDDPTGYAMWVGKINEAAKAKLGADAYVRVYLSNFDGGRTSTVRYVTVADSVVTMGKNLATMESDPVMKENRDHLRSIRKLGARVVYQCVRFDGTHANNNVYTTLAVLSDEGAYLSALNQLRAIFDEAGFKDAKINVYRALAGRTTHTHRISIALPTPERLDAFVDFTGTNAKGAEWIASVAKIRTVVSNGTAREITK